jgi:RNA polymerase sigma factor (sigma-70 family)
MTPDQRQALYDSTDVDRLITMRLARFYVPGYGYDDLVQEGRMAAWCALDSWDADKGKLDTYLTRVIKNAYLGLLEAATAQKRRPPEPLLSFNRLMSKPGGGRRSLCKRLELGLADDTPNVEENALVAERARAICEAVEHTRRSLGGTERAVMECYMAPPPELLVAIRNLGRRKLSKQAVARYLGISPDRVYGILGRIQSELRPVLLDL